MPHKDNFLLRSTSTAAMQRLEPHLTTIQLAQNDILAETHQSLRKVYFPHSGIISCVVELAGGGAIETGMIGRDGVFGASQALDGKTALNLVIVQVPGEASVIDSARLSDAADEFSDLRKLLIRYDEFFLAHVQQTAACNAVHRVEERMCKWLLRMHHLAGNELPLTQDFLAEMMGVRRTSVTAVASELQKSELISYRRGHIRILNLDKIRQHSCECDTDTRSHYDLLFGSGDGHSTRL